MRIFSEYNPVDAPLFRIWERSWRLRGWKPAIIAPKEAARHGSARAAAKVRGSGPLCSARLINFGLCRPRSTPRRFYPVSFGKPGWEVAPLVLFPVGISESDILTCGRAL